MLVKILRGVVTSSGDKAVGDLVDLDKTEAKYLISTKKAELVPEEIPVAEEVLVVEEIQVSEEIQEEKPVKLDAPIKKTISLKGK